MRLTETAPPTSDADQPTPPQGDRNTPGTERKPAAIASTTSHRSDYRCVAEAARHSRRSTRGWYLALAFAPGRQLHDGGAQYRDLSRFQRERLLRDACSALGSCSPDFVMWLHCQHHQPSATSPRSPVTRGGTVGIGWVRVRCAVGLGDGRHPPWRRRSSRHSTSPTCRRSSAARRARGPSARLAGERASSDDRDRSIEGRQLSLASGDHQVLIELDRELHTAIADAAGTPCSPPVDGCTVVLRLWSVRLDRANAPCALPSRARAVVDAIVRGDGADAHARMQLTCAASRRRSSRARTQKIGAVMGQRSTGGSSAPE